MAGNVCKNLSTETDRDNLAGLQVKDIIASIYARIFEELAEVAECIALDSYCDPLKKEYLSNRLPS